jgi:hypothetical protein
VKPLSGNVPAAAILVGTLDVEQAGVLLVSSVQAAASVSGSLSLEKPLFVWCDAVSVVTGRLTIDPYARWTEQTVGPNQWNNIEASSSTWTPAA